MLFASYGGKRAGNATIVTMEKFTKLPWALNSMLTVVGMDLVLMKYLEGNMGMDGAMLKLWREKHKLHYRGCFR